MNLTICEICFYRKLGGGFKRFLFSPLLGELIQLDLYFSNGLKPTTRKPFVNHQNQSSNRNQTSYYFDHAASDDEMFNLLVEMGVIVVVIITESPHERDL